MTPFKVLSAGLAAVVLATPVMARDDCRTTRHIAKLSHARASFTARYTGDHIRTPAPRVRARVTAPENQPGGICDFGDNPMIC